MIPYSRQCIDKDDIRAVTRVLKSRLLTQGPYLQHFEEAIADYCGAKFAVAFSNGTAALHASCHALGLQKGDTGIVSPLSFAASANCLLYVGASPKFADVTKGLPLIDPEKVESSLTSKTKVIIPVHFSGAPVDMVALSQIAKKHRLKIIEDGCHALGASYKDTNVSVCPSTSSGRTGPFVVSLSNHERRALESTSMIRVGSCTHSDLTVFSFHPVKNITTGEGGMVTTNSPDLFQKLKQFRNHGVVHGDPAKQPVWYYEMRMLGWNYRMTEMQAALGLSQLKKLGRFMNEREAQFEFYLKEFEKMEETRLLTPPANVRSSFHLCVMQVKDKKRRDGLFAHLRAKGIGCQLHYIPIYRHPYYKKMGRFRTGDFPNTEDYFSRSISIPMFPGLALKDQKKVVMEIKKFYSQ